MNAKPILFSGPMVRALLEGRKTQTRRIVKPQPTNGWAFENPPVLGRITSSHPKRGRFGAFVRRGLGSDFPEADLIACPYGQPGDLLWVRETWADLLAVSPTTDEPMKIGPGERLIEEPTFWIDGEGRKRWHYDGQVIAYRANSDVEFCDGNGFMGDMADRSDMPTWKPSIHMPRWASRLTLRITDVRVQRLQDISEEDARAEGAGLYVPGHGFITEQTLHADPGYSNFLAPRQGFEAIWTEINGADSWAANPWVWAISFEVIRENVDAVMKRLTNTSTTGVTP